MAQRITAFQAADGTLFASAQDAASYEKTTLLSVGVAAALSALSLTGARVVTENGSEDLQQFLINNSELLVESLSSGPVKTPRKPREPKAPAVGADGSGAVAPETVKKDIPPIVIKADDPAPEVKVDPVNEEAGADVDAELNALLGGDEVSL